MLILLDTNFMAACISSKIDVVGQLEERDVNFEFAVLKRAVVETSYLPPKVVRQVEAFMLANKPQLIGKGGKLEGNSRAEWKGTHPGEKLGLGEEKERKGGLAGKNEGEGENQGGRKGVNAGKKEIEGCNGEGKGVFEGGVGRHEGKGGFVEGKNQGGKEGVYAGKEGEGKRESGGGKGGFEGGKAGGSFEGKGVYAGKEGERTGFGGDGKAVHSDAGKGVFGGKGVFNEGKAETEGKGGFNGGGRAETGGNGFFGVGRPSGNAEEPESEGHLNQTGHTDDLMVLFAKKHHAAVATLDKALKKRLKREGIPIITLARQRVVF